MVDIGSLNPEQRDAVTTVKGPLMILAGAGTGKTRVITVRIAHMIELGVEPSQILGVTFTNKAAREMQERIRGLVPKSRLKDSEGRSKGPTVCTFHSLCVRILRRHIEKLGYKKNFVIYDTSEQLSVIKKLLSSVSDKGAGKPDPNSVLSLISRSKDADAKSGENLSEGEELVLHLRRKYDEALKACNAVDFDDLIVLTLRLFKEHADALEECRERYGYVMVDEYQDTNAAQFCLVKSITEGHRNLCVVGDDDQSIYGWRGADITNLLNLEEHYPEVKVVKLEQNYRSTNTILNAANAVIKNNPLRRGKQLWSKNGEGEKIQLIAYESEDEEAEAIAEDIELHRLSRRVGWGEHAILFRTNIQSRPIETALRRAKIRYNLIGGQSFFDRREIRDFLAFLKVLTNPHDDNSLLRIANTPARGLSAATMQKLLTASHERSCSVYSAMQHTDVRSQFQKRTCGAMDRFLELLNETKEELHGDSLVHLPTGLADWAESFLKEIDYYNDLRRSEKNEETAENRIRALRDLIGSMDGDYGTGKPLDVRLEKFLEQITLDSELTEERDNPENAVTLITMHSCKGLEYPHVYIVGTEEGILPHERSKMEGNLDEERRLFYVAITRAKQTLAISHCATRKKYGELKPCHPSSFLQELPEELTEDASERAKAPVTVSTGRNFFDSMRDALA